MPYRWSRFRILSLAYALSLGSYTIDTISYPRVERALLIIINTELPSGASYASLTPYMACLQSQ